MLVWHPAEKGAGTSFFRSIGEGIVPIATDKERFTAWALDLPDTIVLFDASGLGAFADELRDDGALVICGGRFMDRLEKDRGYGQRIAERAGIAMPKQYDFSSLTDCQEFARGYKSACYFKTDAYLGADATHGCDNGADLADYLQYLKTISRDKIHCVVQEKIDGVALSTLRWWNGTAFIGPFESTIEHKPLMNDDVGPGTGCAFNALWYYPHEEPQVAQLLYWNELERIFREEDAPPGCYDINAVISDDGDAYFLEWTPRLGYDASTTAFRLYDDLGEVLRACAGLDASPRISTDIAYSVRLTVPPYPWEHTKAKDAKTCEGVPIFGADGLWDGNFIAYQLKKGDYALEVACPEGIVGLSLAIGTRISRLGEEANAFAKSLRVPGLQYRTDGAARVQDDALRLWGAGLTDIPRGLTR